ncbi:hypothetical protein [Salipiger mucosus]|uniref:Uncharacterized protein n=1 Tax=Salipiger mucosus DSM 16094 TaxID=1123237 RepID=S9Q5S5_9RHOB|nr:hypothetical protein [Salipiger mucosus]EPX76721.1 hypothetical protein Salmuc_04116 [Salipiger mucosus DSM 16094]
MSPILVLLLMFTCIAGIFGLSGAAIWFAGRDVADTDTPALARMPKAGARRG